jgi:hypothetical protein
MQANLYVLYSMYYWTISALIWSWHYGFVFQYSEEGEHTSFLAQRCGPAIERLCRSNLVVNVPNGPCVSVHVLLTYTKCLHAGYIYWQSSRLDFEESLLFSGGTRDFFLRGLVARRLWWSSGSTLAFSTQVRGFKPGRSRWNFKGDKILSMPSFGGEVSRRSHVTDLQHVKDS